MKGMEKMKMKAVYLEKIKHFETKEIEIPEPGPEEVLIKVKMVGICGSDVHYFENGRIGEFVVNKPLILGHEAAGEIVKVGKKVKNLKPGDRVAMEPGIPCRKCRYCKSGRYNLCPEVKFWATPPIDGVFTEYTVHPADFCFKIPKNVSFEEGAMFEPLSVGLWATEQVDLKPEKKIAILGVGTIGMMTLISSIANGATNITVFDISPYKLEKSEEIGAKEAVLVDSKEKFEKYYGQFDIVFEAAGNESTISQIPYLLTKGGEGVLIGLPSKDDVSLNINMLISKEAKIKTVFRYANMYPRAVELAASGKIKLKSLITKYYNLNQLQEAFEYVINNREKVIKVMIKI